jgi:1-acyl-sn-glycerol-3-phosphate acyltransferase
MSAIYQVSRTERIINATCKGLTALLCRVDADQLKRMPTRGPLIVVTNHVNFLEVPLIYTRMKHTSPVTAFAKAETWDNPIMGRLFDFYGAIPIRRGEADITAIKRGLAALKQGYIMAVTPEGTRSNHGRLLPGHPGVATLALLSKAPLLPIVHYGHETYRQDFSRLRRLDFHVAVGRTFTLDPHGAKVTSDVRQRMTDEIMYQLAALLPAKYRGAYANLTQATQNYLHFVNSEWE